MKDNVSDFEVIRNKKLEDKKKEEEKQKKLEKIEKDMELFKEVIGKNTIFLTPDEMSVYQEVGVVCTFIVEDTYSMAIAVFRGQLYVINHVGGKFEFLGKLEDIISRGIFGGK